MCFTQKPSHPEWTCIALGSTDGYVRFFTDSGHEIFAQQWHQGLGVVALKAQSGKRANEELHIFYGSCVCIVQGGQLVQLLRTLKYNQQRSKFRQMSIRKANRNIFFL